MKSFAPGTFDNATTVGDQLLYGVSATLWKGSSGGPCIILDGQQNGKIMGLGKKGVFCSSIEEKWVKN